MAVEFAILPLGDLKSHEEVDDRKAAALAREIRRKGTVDEPVWVAKGSTVILNGHHRVAALRLLGAVRAPVFLIDYESDDVTLGRWTRGPPISKQEVIDRAERGDLLPPRTTRHRLGVVPTAPLTLLKDLQPDGEVAIPTAAQPGDPRPSRGRAGSTGGR